MAFLAQTTLALERVAGDRRGRRAALAATVDAGPQRPLFRHHQPPGGAEGHRGRCDAVVVIGSANSSNTLALERTARAVGCPRVLRVNGADELPDDLWVRRRHRRRVGPRRAGGGVVARLLPPAEVEEVRAVDEDEYFPLPRELREIVKRLSAAAALAGLAPDGGSAGVDDAIPDDRTMTASTALSPAAG